MMEQQHYHLVAKLDSRSPKDEQLRLAYLDYHPPRDTKVFGTILLIHGFPQTSYQYRHVLPLLAKKGYRCIAPDIRGAGSSSKLLEPVNDYRKSVLAGDMLALLSAIGISEKVHIIGHDIGGMIAFAMASRHPERIQSVCWGECPLPGTRTYTRDRTEPERIVNQFHFAFHCVPYLPEALVAGKERIYLTHFFEKLTHNLAAINELDVEHYVHEFEQPGAMTCGMNLYRALETDAKENREWIHQHGKCKVPSLVLSGDQSRHAEEAEEMGREVTEAQMLSVGVVSKAGHYLAEENPEEFVTMALSLIEKS